MMQHAVSAEILTNALPVAAIAILIHCTANCTADGCTADCTAACTAACVVFTICCYHTVQRGTGSKSRKQDKLTPQAAMGVHSALAKMVERHQVEAGVKNRFRLQDDPGYNALYKQHTHGRSLERMNNVHSQFRRDGHIKMCTGLYAKGDTSAVTGLAMITLAIATVSRGDELRNRTWSNFEWRDSEVIGECLPP